jgi:hypothetical protein
MRVRKRARCAGARDGEESVSERTTLLMAMANCGYRRRAAQPGVAGAAELDGAERGGLPDDLQGWHRVAAQRRHGSRCRLLVAPASRAPLPGQLKRERTLSGAARGVVPSLASCCAAECSRAWPAPSPQHAACKPLRHCPVSAQHSSSALALAHADPRTGQQDDEARAQITSAGLGRAARCSRKRNLVCWRPGRQRRERPSGNAASSCATRPDRVQ